MPMVQLDDGIALTLADILYLKECLIPWDGILVKATTVYSKHMGPVVVNLPLIEVLAKIKEGEEKCQCQK